MQFMPIIHVKEIENRDLHLGRWRFQTEKKKNFPGAVL